MEVLLDFKIGRVVLNSLFAKKKISMSKKRPLVQKRFQNPARIVQAQILSPLKLVRHLQL